MRGDVLHRALPALCRVCGPSDQKTTSSQIAFITKAGQLRSTLTDRVTVGCTMFKEQHCLKCAGAIGVYALSAPAWAQDWSGAYYGGGLGFGAGTFEQGVVALDQVGASVDVSGLIYGGHVGINYQSGALVFGVDAGLSNGPTGATEQGTVGPDYSCISGECFVDINMLGTLRGRVGYVTDIRTMVYGAAGFAIADVEGGIRNSGQEGGSTASGVTYAVGVERITSPFSTVFAEVGYYDLGTLAFGTNEDINPPPVTVDDFTGVGDFVTIRAGINFKF